MIEKFVKELYLNESDAIEAAQLCDGFDRLIDGKMDNLEDLDYKDPKVKECSSSSAYQVFNGDNEPVGVYGYINKGK